MINRVGPVTLAVISLGLLFTAAPAQAVDYDKISRALVKEPDYQSKAPTYTLLVFGPAGKLRVWLVFDGNTVYLDRNGDGDLTGKGERFKHFADCIGVEIADPDGKTRYIINHVTPGFAELGTPPNHTCSLM